MVQSAGRGCRDEENGAAGGSGDEGSSDGEAARFVGCNNVWSAYSAPFYLGDAPTTVFQFTPRSLALGGSSNVWPVPRGVSNVYLDVEFSSGSSLDAGSGDINIQTVNTSGTVLSTYEVDSGSDSGVLNGVKEGSRVRVDVDSDAYDAQAPAPGT